MLFLSYLYPNNTQHQKRKHQNKQQSVTSGKQIKKLKKKMITEK